MPTQEEMLESAKDVLRPNGTLYSLQEMTKELNDLVKKINDSIELAREAKNKLAEVINSGHIQSTLSLLRDDIAFRRNMDLLR